MADSQVAQFFIPKTTANKDKLITDNEYRQILAGQKGWQGQKTAMATAIAQQKRIFHWFLEFPEVFQQGGFNCILGNPPFLGGQKLSGNYGDAFLEFIKWEFAPIGAVDLVTYFFRRIFSIINETGFQSLISTNTIAQGKAREDGLDVILKRGGIINHAIKSMKWPGKAALEVSLVTITKKDWKSKYFLDNKEVQNITAYLDNSVSLINPYTLFENENKSFQGSIVLGMGFLLTKEEAHKYLEKGLKYTQVIKPFLNGDDLNNEIDQSPSRYVITFENEPLEKCRNEFPELVSILERTVKVEREKTISDKINKGLTPTAENIHSAKNWWQFHRAKLEYYARIHKMDKILVIPETTKHLTFSFVPTNWIFSHACKLIITDKYFWFAILKTEFHDSWVRKYSSTLESRMKYITSDAFENFPFPRNIEKEIENNIEIIGKTYHEHRRFTMINISLGLTRTYNLFHYSGLTVAEIQKSSKQDEATCKTAYNDIIKLRELHKQMDEIVLEAYGWGDIKLQHDFYEVDYLPENDRVRYTIHPDARKEVLKRLLELNHTIYEEEIKQGLHKEEDVAKFYEQKGIPVPAEVIAIMVVAKKEKKVKEYKKPKNKNSIVNESESIYKQPGLFEEDNLFSEGK